MNTRKMFFRAAYISATLAAGAALSLGAANAQGKTPAKPANNMAASAAAAPTPSPKILVIDRNAILANAKVGKDIVRQVNEYTKKAQAEFKGESEALQREGQQLQQQVAILSASVKAQKVKAFQNKETAFQAKVEKRQNQIQGGVMQARQKVEQALGPILQGIMAERGANLLLDRGAVIYGTIDVDITGVAIQRLDQKMTSVKVELVNPPAGSKGQ